MCDRTISEDSFMLVYFLDKYKTQIMCDKAVDDCLSALKLIPDWLLTSKMIKKLLTALYADDDTLYFNEDSGEVIFYCNEMSINEIDLNNINFDYTNYDPETIIHVRLLAWHIKFEKHEAPKKELNEELMVLGWHLKR